MPQLTIQAGGIEMEAATMKLESPLSFKEVHCVKRTQKAGQLPSLSLILLCAFLTMMVMLMMKMFLCILLQMFLGAG